jgi:hypothetical protein
MDYSGSITFRSGGLGATDFTGLGKEVAYAIDASNNRTIVYIDTDADKAAEFEIELTGQITLSASDFNLPLNSSYPILNVLRINNYDESTKSTTVALTFSTTGPVTDVCFRSDTALGSCSWSSTLTSPKSYVLSGTVTDGVTDSVYGWAKDSVTGNISAMNKDSILYDITAPIMLGLTINGGATYATTTTSISYTLSGNPSSVCFSETNNNSLCSWRTETTSPQSYTITGGDGLITVYGWAKDSAGNISNVQSDTVTVIPC